MIKNFAILSSVIFFTGCVGIPAGQIKVIEDVVDTIIEDELKWSQILQSIDQSGIHQIEN